MDENPYEPPDELVDYKPVDWKQMAIRFVIFLVAGYFAIASAVGAFVVVIGRADPLAAAVLGLASIGIVAATFYWATRK
jgi:hypothetical protein